MEYPNPRSMRSKLKDVGSPSFAKRNMVPLWWTWLAGFVLISLSLYATQLLPSLIDKNAEQKESTDGDRPGTTITIFSAVDGDVGERHSLALLSWLSLSPLVTVHLFGNHSSLAHLLHPRVTLDSDIDFTFFGRPLFHSMVARARASDSDVSVIIDPESILLPDFIKALQYAHGLEHDWLLVSMSSKLKSSNFPFHTDGLGQWFNQGGIPVKHEKVQQYVRENREWINCDGGKMWAWNTGELPLHAGVMPPFTYGYGFHNEWLLNEALSTDFRFVLDVSEAITMFRPNYDYEDHAMKVGSMSNLLSMWRSKINEHLAARYGSFYFRPLNFSSNPVKLIVCDNIYHLINPSSESQSREDIDFQSSLYSGNDTENINYKTKNGKLLTSFRRFFLGSRQTKPFTAFHFNISLTHDTGRSGTWKKMILGPTKGKKRYDCILNSSKGGRKLDCPKSRHDLALEPASTLPVKFPLDYLLREVTDHEKIVIVSAVGNSYKDMLMSWVCRLRKLKLSNFIIVAIDRELYQFAILQGLPVFLDELSINVSFNACHFGTKCFQRVTKVKSQVVLQVLKLGYHVLLSDVDVYWFKNPLPYLKSFGPDIITVQSDEYNKTAPLNLPRRLNSGFYFVQSSVATTTAFEEIVKHAAASNMSEQPSFYDTFCGLRGSNRVGDDRCVEKDTGLTVHFLDRNKFPNGAYLELWEKDTRKDCERLGCIILHNNWISGRKKKLERQIKKALWDYDASSRMCLQSWQRGKSMSSY